MQSAMYLDNPSGTDIKTKIGAARSFGQLAVVTGILALFMAGAGGPYLVEYVGEARALVTAMSADEGVPHNLAKHPKQLCHRRVFRLRRAKIHQPVPHFG